MANFPVEATCANIVKNDCGFDWDNCNKKCPGYQIKEFEASPIIVGMGFDHQPEHTQEAITPEVELDNTSITSGTSIPIPPIEKEITGKRK